MQSNHLLLFWFISCCQLQQKLTSFLSNDHVQSNRLLLFWFISCCCNRNSLLFCPMIMCSQIICCCFGSFLVAATETHFFLSNDHVQSNHLLFWFISCCQLQQKLTSFCPMITHGRLVWLVCQSDVIFWSPKSQ